MFEEFFTSLYLGAAKQCYLTRGTLRDLTRQLSSTLKSRRRLTVHYTIQPLNYYEYTIRDTVYKFALA